MHYYNAGIIMGLSCLNFILIKTNAGKRMQENSPILTNAGKVAKIISQCRIIRH